MNKCVIILDENLPLGLLANASAVLAMTIGKRVDGIIGDDIVDGSGNNHLGITRSVLPILKTSSSNLMAICNIAKKSGEITVVDFCDVAQRSRKYEDYKTLLENLDAEQLNYVGIALYGNKERVNSLSGSLPLLR